MGDKDLTVAEKEKAITLGGIRDKKIDQIFDAESKGDKMTDTDKSNAAGSRNELKRFTEATQGSPLKPPPLVTKYNPDVIPIKKTQTISPRLNAPTTTNAPTTNAPTTNAPTTNAPTNNAPTTTNAPTGGNTFNLSKSNDTSK